MREVARDPRLARIERELSKRRVILVTGVKGGVGKTIVSVLLALALRKRGFKPLLVDADVSDPNMHVALGIDPARVEPGEEKGIKPVEVDGVGYIGIAPYTRNKPAPLRGQEAVDAVREMLGALDYDEYTHVVIDTPPGLSDVLLDLLNIVDGKASILVVTTPSKMAYDSAKRYIELLREEGYTNVEMVVNDAVGVGRRLEEIEGHYVPHDPGLEEALGYPRALAETEAFRSIEELAERLG
ncbi:P-loop NTPase [Stetteria hydrogenophila]